MVRFFGLLGSELQKRGGIEDNSKIIFLISQQKHVVTPMFLLRNRKNIFELSSILPLIMYSHTYPSSFICLKCGSVLLLS